MAEIKEADEREPHSPRSKKSKINSLNRIIATIKENQNMHLNNALDKVLDKNTDDDLRMKGCNEPRRTKSATDFQTLNAFAHLDEGLSDLEKKTGMSWPAADLDEELLQLKFSEHLMYLKLLELDKNNKNE